MKHTKLSLTALADRIVFATANGIMMDWFNQEIKDAKEQSQELVGKNWADFLAERKAILAA